jgi:hypothetical protein
VKPRRIPYSAMELAFIEARLTMKRHELHAAFVCEFNRVDVSVDHIKSLCTRRGWTWRERWSAEDDALLRTLYPHASTDDVARRLGRSVSATYGRANKLGLAKSEAYLASPAACRLRRGDNVGAACRFGKGHVPANKGLRRPGWAPGRMKETQFKKGTSRNKMPIGSERIIDGYRYTKVSDVSFVPYTVNWKPNHVLSWTQINGPVPKGYCLKSLDSNPLNADPANWIAIPRSMLPLLSGRHGVGYDDAPEELKPTLLALAKVRHASNAVDGETVAQRMIRRRKARNLARPRNECEARR